MEIINLVPASGETQGELSLLVPKSGARPLDIRISSEVVPDLLTKKESQTDGFEENRQVTIHLQERPAASESISTADDRNGRAPSRAEPAKTELEAYVTYRSEGLATKSKDWITRSSEALWESTRGEISHQTMTASGHLFLKNTTRQIHIQKCCVLQSDSSISWPKTNIDPRYVSFKLFLERPKTKKVKKRLQRGLSLAKTLAQFLSALLQ